MRNVGLAVILGSLALAGLFILLWLAGVVFNVAGGLVHLLLLFAPLVAFAGITAGVVILIIARRQGPKL